MEGDFVSRTKLKTVTTTVLPFEHHVPPAGVAIGCLATPVGPVVTVTVSDGRTGLTALIANPQQEPVIDQLIAAMERAGTMAAPRPEPEVRRDD